MARRENTFQRRLNVQIPPRRRISISLCYVEAITPFDIVSKESSLLHNLTSANISAYEREKQSFACDQRFTAPSPFVPSPFFGVCLRESSDSRESLEDLASRMARLVSCLPLSN